MVFIFTARKAYDRQVPIVRTDNDMDTILDRSDKSVNNILDLFILSSVKIHILRAIEPNLRFGAAIKNSIEQNKSIPRCPFWNTEDSDKCLRVASRKQIGEAIVRFQDNVDSKH